MKVLVAKLCLTLCNPMYCRPPGSSAQARILEWVAIPFSRGIFPTEGLNPSLLNCRQILYYLSHQGSPNLAKTFLKKKKWMGEFAPLNIRYSN